MGDVDGMAELVGDMDNKTTFDPLRIEDLIQDMQLHFDVSKPGRYDDRAKLSAIASATTDPGLRDLVRGWMRNGMPNRAGGHTAWRAATWLDGQEALRICYPDDSLADRSATDLGSFKQSQHAAPHVRSWLQLREDVGSPIDL
jgi:hypothetical protein